MRNALIATALCLTLPASAQTVDTRVKDLRDRLTMCSLIADTAREKGIKETDLIDQVLASDKMSDDFKLKLLETCIAFMGGRSYEVALMGPRA